MVHRMEDSSEKPICYISRTQAERNYVHIEKEGLALVFAVKKLHQYFLGNTFIMFSDNKLLLGLFADYKPILAMFSIGPCSWLPIITS